MCYHEVGDEVGVGGDLEDVEIGNDGVGDGGNQDNRNANVEDVVDSDNGVTSVVDPTNRVLTDVLAHSFGLSSTESNSPLGVTAICSSQFHGNK